MRTSEAILIVEDDPDWQKELSSMLSEAGYRCTAAGNYASGLEDLRRYRPLALVLDLQLRSKHLEDEDFIGWKLAQQALEDDVPIIIVTGHPSVTRARKAFRDYKVIDFLDKEHLSRRELVERVSEGVKASRRKQLSNRSKQRAVEKIREIFYGGGRIGLRNIGRE